MNDFVNTAPCEPHRSRPSEHPLVLQRARLRARGLYVSCNFGIPDPHRNDSSHLPVMLTIYFEEYLED